MLLRGCMIKGLHIMERISFINYRLQLMCCTFSRNRTRRIFYPLYRIQLERRFRSFLACNEIEGSAGWWCVISATPAHSINVQIVQPTSACQPTASAIVGSRATHISNSRFVMKLRRRCIRCEMQGHAFWSSAFRNRGTDKT